MKYPQQKAIRALAPVVLAILVSACSSVSVAPEKGQGVDPSKTAQQIALERAQAELAKVQKSVFFAYDSFEVSESFRDVVTAHANYLNAAPSARIVIEGNADDRGTSEYNLALGQKRADAVGSSLKALGVQASRIETVSFGEERPRAKGEDEAARAENRRADLVLR